MSQPTQIVHQFSIPVGGFGVAYLKIPVPISQSDFDMIVDTLQVWRKNMVYNPTLSIEEVLEQARQDLKATP